MSMAGEAFYRSEQLARFRASGGTDCRTPVEIAAARSVGERMGPGYIDRLADVAMGGDRYTFTDAFSMHFEESDAPE